MEFEYCCWNQRLSGICTFSGDLLDSLWNVYEDIFSRKSLDTWNILRKSYLLVLKFNLLLFIESNLIIVLQVELRRIEFMMLDY